MGAYWPHLYLLVLIVVIWGLEKLYPRASARAEEMLLVMIMTSIMLVSFGQVIARYGFNTGWSAALEYNTTAFSWLILLGISYGIRTNLHLGVDIVLRTVSRPVAKLLGLFGAVCCLLYGLILLDASWLSMFGIDARGGALDYWAKMYKVRIGAEELRYPRILQDMFGLQPRIHRWIILLVLPIGLALLVYRALQAFIDILRGQRESLISGHEADEQQINETKKILQD